MGKNLAVYLKAAKDAIAVVDGVMGQYGGAPNKPEEIRGRIRAEQVAEAARSPKPKDEAEKVEQKTEAKFQTVKSKLETQMGKIRSEFVAKHKDVEPWNKDKLLELARLAKKHSAGQCNEQVAIAFARLRELGVTPVDLMLQLPRSADHVFLVIGRTAKDPKKVEWDWKDDKDLGWGDDAVVCDPWTTDKSKRAYAAAEVAKTMDDVWGVKTLLRWTGG